MSNGCKSSAGGEEGGGLTRGRKSALAEDDHALVVRDVLRRVRDVPERAGKRKSESNLKLMNEKREGRPASPADDDRTSRRTR